MVVRLTLATTSIFQRHWTIAIKLRMDVIKRAIPGSTIWLKLRRAVHSINWQAVEKVSTSEIVGNQSLASAEIYVTICDLSKNSNGYPDTDEHPDIKVIFGEEVASDGCPGR